MKIIIHRGTHQIGGCITEIKTKQARIFIDMGAELPKSDVNSTPSSNIKIEGVTAGIADCDAVFFTHYHGDHIGLISDVLSNIPLYMGGAARDIFLTFYERMGGDNIGAIKNIIPFSANQPIQVKDIKITPFVVDHSAYDAYMFLIEANGKKILHTGDFRTHGFRGKGLIPTLKKYVGQVDVLITEGTTLSRKDNKVMTESKLQQNAKQLLQDNKYVFVLCSSTNIDRIAAFYSATPKGKYFICDKYQSDILNIAKAYGEKYSSLYSFNKVLTFGNNLLPKLQKKGFCMIVRSNRAFKEIMNKFDKKDCLVIFSLWEGYLQQNENDFSEILNEFNWQPLHTSGHATKKAIIDVCNTVKPQIGIVPIHSEAPTQLSNLQLPYPIKYLKDNEVFEL